jgi:hypothetical protein
MFAVIDSQNRIVVRYQIIDLMGQINTLFKKTKYTEEKEIRR